MSAQSIQLVHPSVEIVDVTDEGEFAKAVEVGSDDSGMSTAEYAVGLAVACAFAGVLLVIIQSHQVFDLLMKVVSGAFKAL